MKTRSILSLAVLTLVLALGASRAFAAPGPLGPNEFRDCPECPRMVRVPAGTFVMGTPLDEYGAHFRNAVAPKDRLCAWART